MNWINQIAFYQNVKNETPNRALAKLFAENNNAEGIKEMANYLYDKNKSVASDCLAVMYEAAYINPELLANYANTFVDLLKSKNNRMVWGAMIALATISKFKPEEIFSEIELVLETMRKGTLITEVWGIKLLASLSTIEKKYKEKLLPILFDYLEKCRPIDFASRVEVIAPSIQIKEEKEIFDRIIEIKTPDLSEAQKTKLKAVLRMIDK